MSRLIQLGHETTSSYLLDENVILGRSRSCRIRIDDPSVSRRHAEILQLQDGRFRVLHVGKRNPTYVNGQSVREAYLNDGDIIAIGPAQFRFETGVEGGFFESVEYDDTLSSVRHRRDLGVEPDFLSPEIESVPRDEGTLTKLRIAYGFIRAVGLERNVDALLERLMDALFAGCHPDHGVILLLDARTKQLIPRKIRPHYPDERTRLSRSILRQALKHREALLSTDATSDARFNDSKSVISEGIRSVMCVPMVDRDELVGVIHLDSRTFAGRFDESDLELATTFARHAGMAINNASLQSQLISNNEKLREANVAIEQFNRELRSKNRELQKLVVRDPVTGLYNQTYLQERLEQETLRCRRHNLQLSLLLINVDRFRQINDTLGYTAGNRILERLAKLFGGDIRASDVGGRVEGRDITTRYDSDVFAILLPETRKRNGAAKAESLRAKVQSLSHAQSAASGLTISVGVAGFPEDAGNEAELLAAADAALRAAKRSGGNQVVGYSPALDELDAGRTEEAEAEIGRIQGLDRVLANRAIRYLYQPIVETGTCEVFAYEALCRPTDPAFSNPLELISAAERGGRICELGAIMRELSLRALSDLPEPHQLFINIHPLELNEELVRWGESQREHSHRIVLEITETMEVGDHDMTRRMLRELKEMGFRIAVDDLGAGYSGLNSLVNLEPDFAKLDMLMLRGIRSDSRSARLIRHILDYSDGEGMKVVAEGIETSEEYQVVTDLGCHLVQGYLFAKPSPPFCQINRP